MVDATRAAEAGDARKLQRKEVSTHAQHGPSRTARCALPLDSWQYHTPAIFFGRHVCLDPIT